MDTSILILSSLRCGGWYLTKYLAKVHNLEIIHEPRKLLIPQTPSIIKIPVLHRNRRVDRLVDYANHFNKVVLLDRKDKEAQAKSLLVLREVTNQMDLSWDWDESYSEVGKGYNFYVNHLNNYSNRLKELSSILDVPISYYEELYNPNLKNDLNFKPDLKKRYKKVVKKTTI